MAALEVRRSVDLSDFDRAMLWALLTEAFAGDFSAEDWSHALGGLHVVVSEDAQPVAHAAVVGRTMLASGRPVSVGYVEAVATRPRWRKQGHATEAMKAVGTIIGSDFEMGALSTGEDGFYARLGWEHWRGTTYVQTETGRVRTADDDGGIMILRTSHTLYLETTGHLICEWRPGDVW